jgi:hypothetical protein
MSKKRRTSKGSPGAHVRRRLSATELARNLSEVLSRVRYRREVFVVERGGHAVCEVRPAGYESSFNGSDLVQLLRALPSPGKDYLERVEQGLDEQPAAEGTRWER